MADLKVKISEFPLATESKDTDDFAILQDGENKRIKSPKLEEKLLVKVEDRYVNKNQLGVNNGVATLGSDGILSVNQRPSFNVQADFIPINLLSPSSEVDGVFVPTESGVYENYGNIEIDLNDGTYIITKISDQYQKSLLAVQSPKSVNTISELRSREGDFEGQIITLLGYYETGDKEPLNYKYTTEQGIDDGGSVINSTTGSWIALFNDIVDVRDFGAKGDGITDDTLSVRKSLTTISGFKINFDRNKTYIITSHIRPNPNIHINLNFSTLKFKIPTANNIHLLSLDDYSTVENGNVELEHGIPGITPSTGENLSPINVGTYVNADKAPTNITLRNLKIKTNVKGVMINMLGAKNTIIENIVFDANTYAKVCIQHHWSNTRAAVNNGDGTYSPSPIYKVHHPKNNIIRNIEAYNAGEDNTAIIYLSGIYQTIVDNVLAIDGTFNNGITVSMGEFGIFASEEYDKQHVLGNIYINNVSVNIKANAVQLSALANDIFTGPILKAQGSVSINNLNSTGHTGISGLFFNDVIITNCNIIHKNTGINFRNGLGKLKISNVNIEGDGDDIRNNIRVRGDVNNKASLIFDNISVKNGNNTSQSVTEHANSNIYIEGYVQYGRITNIYIGSELESAKNNIAINNSPSNISIKNIIFDNIIIASNSGGRCFLQSTSPTFKMIHAAESKIIIKNLEVLDSNILNKYNALHFLSDIRGGCPVFRLGRGITKDNTGIKGTIVEYTDIPRSSTLNETQVLGEILSDVENDTWIYYSLIGVDLGKRSTGTTAQRPIVTQIGYRYYDTSLNRAVYWNGTLWVNSDPDATTTIKGLVNQTPAIVNITTPAVSTIEEADTQIQALTDKINSLLTAMRAAGMIAP